MENYTRVKQPPPEEKTEENELRITSGGKPRNYITNGHAILTEKGHTSLTLRAMGKAINRTVAIAEILKRRVPGLHQITTISSTELTDVWEPNEEGLDRIETVRRASTIAIVLSTEPLDTSAVGYQAPLPEAEVTAMQPEEEAALAGDADAEGGVGGPEGRSRRPGRGRGRGRGRRAPRTGDPVADAAAEAGEGADEGQEEGGQPRRGRARPRRRRGRGRGEGAAEGGEGAAGPAAEAPAPPAATE